MRYAELFCKTNSSFLQGASHPAELVTQAATLGLDALAITDVNGVYGAPKAYLESRNFPSLKLITGATLELNDHPAIRLLARDRAAYGLLCRILTSLHQAPHFSWSQLTQTLDHYPEAARGLLVFPESFCSGSAPSQLPAAQNSTLHAHWAEPRWGELKEIFKERLSLPLCRLLDGHDAARTQKAREIAQRYALPWVAVNDVHFHLPARKPLQDLVTAIRTGKPLRECGWSLQSNGERYLKSPAQMAALFEDAPQALGRGLEIAESCTFSLSELRYQYPSEWIPSGYTAQQFLNELTWKGAARRYGDALPRDVRKQLEHELRLIEQLHYADYFLTLWDIVEFARKKGILCQGRGSAANSAVCYVLGITAIDPVRMNLLFERFISAERNEPPDIDVDFEAGRREEVIQYIYDKYGRHRAGMVAAVVTYRSKLALREVSKVLDAPPEDPMAQTLAEELQGFPRHLSIHSGGFTLSKDPLIETVPIEPASMEGRTIVQWDKNDLEAIGLLKVDILALGMLSAVQRCFQLLKGRYDLANLPRDDAPTWEMIQRADTVGVFQIESRAQMGMLPRLKPREFYDLVVQVAIVRPGPIVGKMVHPYLRRRRGEEPATLPHPALEPILGRTLGVPIFQEQVMKMAMVLAGFTAGQADELRRAMGAWKSSGKIEKLGGKLRDGLLKNGLPIDFVDRIFEQIRGFAEYGFPESHAASFAHITWASCFLKRHFPAEFACSLINSQPMGFYSVNTLIEDAKRHGVRVLAVDPQLSDWECTLPHPGTLQLGWNVVKGLGEKDALRIVEERRLHGLFTSLSDFLKRTRLKPQVLHQLALGDAFCGFGVEPRQALWQILDFTQGPLKAPGQSSTSQNPTRHEQLAFDFQTDSVPQAMPQLRPLSEYEAISASFSAFGLSTQGHPMQALRKMVRALPRLTLSQIKTQAPGTRLKAAGLLIVRQRPPTAKGTAFGTLEDETGLLDLIFRKEVFEKIKATYWESPWLIVEGTLQREGHASSLVVTNCRSIT